MDQLEENLLPAYQELFTKYPNLKSFEIIAYTPYFNDGDPCYYRSYVNEVEAPNATDVERIEIELALSNFIYAFPTEVLENTYGESRVTISRSENGEVVVNTEDYTDHD